MKGEVTTQSSRVINAVPFFYGWVILIVGTLAIIMIGPSQTFTVGIFIDYFIVELAISRATLSLIYGGATLGASLLLPLSGRYFDRYGARPLALVAALGLGIACLILSQVQSILAIFIGFLLLRFTGFGSLQLASNNLIAQWFIRRRGLAMGVAGLSLAVGFLVFPLLTEALIDLLDWRRAWIALGGLVWVTILPIVLIFFKNQPERYGLLPDGDYAAGTTAHQSTSLSGPINEENWTLPEARRTGAFWLFVIALATMAMALAGLVFHQLSLFEVRGLNRELGILGFQITALASVAANLTIGRLIDQLSARQLLAITLIFIVAALGLVQTMTTPWQALIYSALIGWVSGSFRVIDGVVWAKYFGRRYLGSIRGTTMIGAIGATSLGPYPLGLSLDITGSYAAALTPMAILAVGISFTTIFIKRPQKPE